MKSTYECERVRVIITDIAASNDTGVSRGNSSSEVEPKNWLVLNSSEE